jgi:DNA-binding transcriptional ArsR family regulator
VARIRSIKPAFFTSLTITSLPVPTRLTFIGLWTYVDDDGRAVDDPRLVKAEVWPLDDKITASVIGRHLGELEKAHLVERYVHDGRRYLRVRGWREHQVVNRPKPSRFPPSPEECLNDPGAGDDASGSDHGSGDDEDVSDQGAVTDPSVREVEGKGDGGGTGGGTLSRLPVGSPPQNGTVPAGAGGEGETWGAEGWTPSERAKAEALVDRVVEVVRPAKGRPSVRDARQLVTWAAGHLDWGLVDEAIGYCGALSDTPRSVAYLGTTIRSWGAQRGVELPAFGNGRRS